MTQAPMSPGVALEAILKKVERHSLGSREYIESRFIIRNKQKQPQLLTFNRVQERIWGEIEDCQERNRPVKIDILKYRQPGVSTFVLALFFDKVIRSPGTCAVSITHEDDSTNHFRMIIKRFYKNLPPDEKPRMKYDRKGYFYFPDLDSEYHIWTAGSRGVARSFTANLLHASEVSQWPGEPAQIWAGPYGSATPGAWFMRESTPQGMGWWYQLWLKDKEAGATYTPLFFPWWMQEEYRALYPVAIDDVTPEEREFLVKSGIDLYQLAWRRMKIKELGELFFQEYPEDDVSCFLGLETCVFDVAKCKQNLERAGKVKPLMVDENGALKIWKTAEPGRKYVAGCDPSTGDPQGDAQGLGILDWETGEAVADLHGYWPLNVFTYKAVALCEIYNNALFAIERDAYGHFMLRILTEDVHYPNLYSHRDYDTNREKLGWVTSHKTRGPMIEGLANAIREDSIWVPDSLFWRECLSFIRTTQKKEGEAAAGTHDDRVIKYAIAWDIRRDIRAPTKVQEIQDLAPSPL